jgi:hypothetical protein
MRRDPVASSNIVSIGYDASSETLEIEFQKLQKALDLFSGSRPVLL